jgi:S-ribosylhomocysteine lyase
MLRKIASFTVNHDTLSPGMYRSRVDGDCVTWDLRLKTPNRAIISVRGRCTRSSI